MYISVLFCFYMPLLHTYVFDFTFIPIGKFLLTIKHLLRITGRTECEDCLDVVFTMWGFPISVL